MADDKKKSILEKTYVIGNAFVTFVETFFVFGCGILVILAFLGIFD